MSQASARAVGLLARWRRETSAKHGSETGQRGRSFRPSIEGAALWLDAGAAVDAARGALAGLLDGTEPSIDRRAEGA